MRSHNLFIAMPFIIISFAFILQENQPDIVQAGAKLEKLAEGFLFTEGPAADINGNVYFTDQPNDRIMVWSTSEVLTTFLQPCGRSNGLYFDKDGILWACADEKNELWQITPDKKISVIVGRYKDNPLNGPNDLWITRNGGIYFTDPFYRRTWWSHTAMPQDKQGVYYLAPDHKTITRVADDLRTPNGIVGSKDGKTLFVADIGEKRHGRIQLIKMAVSAIRNFSVKWVPMV